MDKTQFVARLVNSGSYYFLSRPRRFGKTLLLDTLKQAFLGNKEVFKGLYLENNWDWDTSYPVIHISFAGEVHDIKLLQQRMHDILNETILHYAVNENQDQQSPLYRCLNEKLLSTKFSLLIPHSAQKYRNYELNLPQVSAK